MLTVSMLAATILIVPVTSPPEIRGPKVDLIKNIVTRASTVRYTDFMKSPPEIDILPRVALPTQVEDYVAAGKTVAARESYYYLRMLFNYYKGGHPSLGGTPLEPLVDVNFRLALAHLMPKDAVIAEVLRFTVVKAETLMTPAAKKYHDPNVAIYDFSPEKAEEILGLAGYQKGTDGIWRMPDGTDIPTLEVLSHMQEDRPDGYAPMDYFVRAANAIGLTSIVLAPMESDPKIDWIYNKWTFKLAGTGADASDSADELFSRYSPDQYYKGSRVPYGMQWYADYTYADLDGLELAKMYEKKSLDYWTDLTKYSMDEAEVFTASQAVQEMVRGGTITKNLVTQFIDKGKPVPRNDNYWNWSVPDIIVWAANRFHAAQPELKGLVNNFAMGMWAQETSKWSELNMFWDANNDGIADAGRPWGSPIEGTMNYVVINIESYPTSAMNPPTYYLTYDGDFIRPQANILMWTNPFTRVEVPWIATARGIALWDRGPTIPAGCKVWYKLRTDVYWADGYPFTIDDVKFAIEFHQKWQIPVTKSTWDYIDHVELDRPNNIVTVFFKTKGLSFLGDINGFRWHLPPQIYNRTWVKYDTLASYDPVSESYKDAIGQTGYAAGPWAYGPDNTPNTPDDVTPTALFTTGPYILTKIDPGTPRTWAIYKANRNFFLTQTEIDEKLKYVFWRAGDQNKDGIINSIDLSGIAARCPSPPLPYYNAAYDITGSGFRDPDGKINVIDLLVAGMYSGEKRTIP